MGFIKIHCTLTLSSQRIKRNQLSKISISLFPAFGTFSSYRVASPSFGVRLCIWFYCVLFCHIQLLSLGGLFFEAMVRVGWGVDLGRRGDEGRE